MHYAGYFLVRSLIHKVGMIEIRGPFCKDTIVVLCIIYSVNIAAIEEELNADF